MGNTCVKAARVTDAAVEEIWRVPTAQDLEVPTGLPAVSAAVVSVVPAVTPRVLETLEAATGCPARLAGRDFPVPLDVDYETPESLGPDRLFACFAAWREFPAGALVVDAGSTVTVDWVDGDGRFRGGAIGPGPDLIAGTLKGGAAALEWGHVRPEARWPGTSSAASCDVGVTAAFRGMVADLVEAARARTGSNLPLVLDGGAASLVSALLPGLPWLVREGLVHRGLAAASHG